MLKKYTDRLNLPLEGFNDIKFFTHVDLLIAEGYETIKFIDNFPYIQFNKSMIFHSNIYIVNSQKWRASSEFSKYLEFRSKDCCAIKIINYKKNPDLYFISPFNIKSDKIETLIAPLRRKKNSNLE